MGVDAEGSFSGVYYLGRTNVTDKYHVPLSVRSLSVCNFVGLEATHLYGIIITWIILSSQMCRGKGVLTWLDCFSLLQCQCIGCLIPVCSHTLMCLVHGAHIRPNSKGDNITVCYYYALVCSSMARA